MNFHVGKQSMLLITEPSLFPECDCMYKTSLNSIKNENDEQI